MCERVRLALATLFLIVLFLALCSRSQTVQPPQLGPRTQGTPASVSDQSERS